MLGQLLLQISGISVWVLLLLIELGASVPVVSMSWMFLIVAGWRWPFRILAVLGSSVIIAVLWTQRISLLLLLMGAAMLLLKLIQPGKMQARAVPWLAGCALAILLGVVRPITWTPGIVLVVIAQLALAAVIMRYIPSVREIPRFVTQLRQYK